jgi:hypothetical protein
MHILQQRLQESCISYGVEVGILVRVGEGGAGVHVGACVSVGDGSAGVQVGACVSVGEGSG